MAKASSGSGGKPRKPARSPAAKPRAAAAKAAPPGGGPVTLEEAQALARAKQPALALRTAKGKAAVPTSPEPVALKREERDKRAKDELDRRIREYKATMAILKKRGALPPAARPGPKRMTAAPQLQAFVPLQVVAEGDSWFDYPYPVPFWGGGIIPRLQAKLGVPILNLSDAGDEVRFMLGVKQRKVLTAHLAAGCPAGGPWDALLFSGGGNDIVDNPMALWIRDWDPALPAAAHIHQPRFDMALAMVRAGYEDLIGLRDQLSPNTHLVFHGYDFAIPDGRGVCHLGPWLKPTFDLRKFPNLAARQAVVTAMLEQFAAMLQSLAAQPKVTFINGQGTLPAQKSAWHNELHPSKAGFQKFADIFHRELKALFPNRVA